MKRSVIIYGTKFTVKRMLDKIIDTAKAIACMKRSLKKEMCRPGCLPKRLIPLHRRSWKGYNYDH